MNSIYEVHAFFISFVVAFVTFFLTYLVFIWKEKDKLFEAIVSLFLIVGVLGFLYYIPEWVMQNNLYQEPFYAVSGLFVGLISGILLAHIIKKRRI